MNTRLLPVLAASALLTFSTSAHAVLADLTSSVWTIVDGTTDTDGTPASAVLEATFGGVTVTLTSTGGNLNNLEDVADSGLGLCDGTLDCDFDGFGVGTGAPGDEVGPNQTIKVTFSESVTVTDIYVLDMFFAEGEVSQEGATADFTNGNIFDLGADETFSTAGNGDASFDLSDGSQYTVDTGSAGDQLTTMIVFSNLDGNDGNGVGDFALAGIEFTVDEDPNPIPVPATLPLLLSGIAGLALYRRRRAA